MMLFICEQDLVLEMTNNIYWDDIYSIRSEYGGPWGADGGNAFKIEFDIYGIELSDYFNI